jgi:putrescine aminotransferase
VSDFNGYEYVLDRNEVIDLYRAHLGEGQGRVATMLDLPLEESAAGSVIRTADGRELINCGGYGAFFVGAGHPRVLAAVRRQLDRQALSTRLLLNEAAATAGRALTRVTPPGLDKVHFSCSGAEAVETAIKIARANGRNRLISMIGGYHGKTMGALTVTGRTVYQAPFHPLLPQVSHVPFGDLGALLGAFGEDGSDVCVIVEPVQSEGGVVIPPPGYLKAVAAACRERGALLVLDEIMTGLGRLGAWWGGDLEEVVPDILLVGKGLSGGVVPVSATVSTAEFFAPFDADPYLHTATYSAAPIAMAAVRATVEVIESEGLVQRSRTLGEQLAAALRESVARHAGHLVTEVRGRGLLIGVEFVDGRFAAEFLLDLMDCGVVANHSMNAHPVVRLTPPAVLGDAELRRLAEALERAVAALAARFPAPARVGA